MAERRSVEIRTRFYFAADTVVYRNCFDSPPTVREIPEESDPGSQALSNRKNPITSSRTVSYIFRTRYNDGNDIVKLRVERRPTVGRKPVNHAHKHAGHGFFEYRAQIRVRSGIQYILSGKGISLRGPAIPLRQWFSTSVGDTKSSG